jgi:hypothetical protein
MDGLELELAQRVVERWHRGPAKPRGEAGPLARGPVMDFAELPEDVDRVRVERQVQPVLPDRPARAK